MADSREPQYDPYIPSGGHPAAGGATAAAPQPGTQRTAALQATTQITSESPVFNLDGTYGLNITILATLVLLDEVFTLMRMCLIAGIIILLIVIIVQLVSNIESNFEIFIDLV
ncbi:hypothetical protein LAWI1_G005664 [Lachnellula willkommii]|uniref:Uncharacterized protein n=1 Tax=Lachnellula willkommii TaxID=215461 RepID=A0A559MCC2_9HELO|nr:hypothetical protein LAWI1_G005664 [Lachnellula willkommii]